MIEAQADTRTTWDWGITEAEAETLNAMGQFYAAGFMLGADTSVPMRFANAIDNYLRRCDLHPYDGEPLYPSKGCIWTAGRPQVLWQFYVELGAAPHVADGLLAEERTDDERSVLMKARRCCETYPRGGGYTHSIINYGRILREGLASYRERIDARRDETGDADKREFYRALLVVAEAIDVYRRRVGEYLAGLSFDDPSLETNRARLADAYLGGLPMRPAQGFFEAMVSTIFMFAIDSSDNLGRFDQFMWPYYSADMESSDGLSRAEALELVKTLWKYIDDCCGYNVTVAGSDSEGGEASNDLSLLCIEAAKGRRRPNMVLRLRMDTPGAVLDSAIETLSTGCGIPAIYSEENYLAAIDEAHLGLSDADRYDYAFAGCTELMVQGASNVGSLEGDLNVLKQLEETLYKRLPDCASFDELMAAFKEDLQALVYSSAVTWSANQEARSLYEPLLIRSLCIDDCIDRGRNYSDGGARCNWGIINVVGLSNAIDSLMAVRRAVYEEGIVSSEGLLSALRTNFEGEGDLLTYLKGCPRFGNDDAEVNDFARELSGFVYREIKRYAPWRGGRFLPATLMFVTYGMYGTQVGATPDGRLAGTVVGDSAGPVQGRDTSGPTAMLRSTASLQQEHAPGTLVVNLRLSGEVFKSEEGRAKLKGLIRGYFALGGLQLQISVVDQEILRDALAHPEDHNDLIIRIGGYSEYFNWLPDDVKLAVLDRVEHS